jgi:hypothetical protein
MQTRIVRRIEAGFDSKRSEPAFSRHKWARTRAPIGLHSREFHLDPILFSANNVPQKGQVFIPGDNEHSTSPSFGEIPKGASPATVRLRNLGPASLYQFLRGVIAQIANTAQGGVVPILAKASWDFRVNVTCNRTKVQVPFFIAVHYSRAPTDIQLVSWNSRKCRAESLRAAPKAASARSPLQTVCIGSALFLPWSSVRVAAPIAEAAPGSLSSRLFSATPESGGTPRFDPWDR